MLLLLLLRLRGGRALALLPILLLLLSLELLLALQGGHLRVPHARAGTRFVRALPPAFVKDFGKARVHLLPHVCCPFVRGALQRHARCHDDALLWSVSFVIHCRRIVVVRCILRLLLLKLVLVHPCHRFWWLVMLLLLYAGLLLSLAWRSLRCCCVLTRKSHSPALCTTTRGHAAHASANKTRASESVTSLLSLVFLRYTLAFTSAICPKPPARQPNLLSSPKARDSNFNPEN